MEESQGWVKLHRKLLDNCISDKPEYFSLWVHLLLLANHQESTFIWNNKKQIIKAGQFLTGLKVLAKKTGIAQGTVYRILKYLENEKQIETQKTTKYTIISIVNWNKYQGNETQNEKQIENRLKTNEKQIETNKNDNNIKNEKKYISSESKDSGIPTLKIDPVKFINWFNEATGKKYRLKPKIFSQLRTAEALGYTKEDMKTALENALSDEFIIGDNDSGKWYLTPEYFLRPQTLDKYINFEVKKDGVINN